VKFEVEPELNPTQVGHIVAIVQESLSNTLRHGNGRRVSLDLCREANRLMLKLQDDGHGFDERTITPGYGLRAMRDRARLLGGTLLVQSPHGKGTTITLQIPEENGL
jgi:signal transduction histidine kinase